MNPDELYTAVHPDYFATQQKDLFWYERLWRVLLRRIGKPKGILLDWGSGPGFLLALAQREGWVCVGEEPSAVAREHAQRLGVYCVPSLRGEVSAIISTETLEHVEDPGLELLRLFHLLRPGGKLALSVPNDNNPLQRLFWGRSKPWLHHTHLNYFNPRSLRALVESVGFKVTWQGTSFPVELLLALPISRKLAWKLSRVWPAPPLLWRFGIGRHCLLAAEKP
jgi:SAM-dependent methyltransferase